MFFALVCIACGVTSILGGIYAPAVIVMWSMYREM